MAVLKVYVAGKITGTNKDETIQKFQKAADMLTIMGFEPINPMSFGINWETTSNKALETCLPYLERADILFMLSDWRSSDGAVKELNHFIEKKTIRSVVFEDEKGYSVIIRLKNINQIPNAPKLYPIYEEN